MRVLLKRALTGAVYVGLLLAAVFLNTDAFDFLFMGFGLACLYELNRMSKLEGYPIYLAYLLLWWLFIYFLHDSIFEYVLLAVTLGVNTYLMYLMFNLKSFKFTKHKNFFISLFYIGGGLIFLTKSPYQTEGFIQLLIAGFFITIWVNDTFAFLVGKYTGKHKLFKSVSPNKTIEGAIGGMLFALLAAYIISLYDHYLNSTQWLILGFLIVVFGNIGDLIESKFKRTYRMKDSGAILPGHGGILDRLDSLVFASPIVYLYLLIINYVS